MDNANVEHNSAVERIIASQLLHIEERIDRLNRCVARLSRVVDDNESERSLRYARRIAQHGTMSAFYHDNVVQRDHIGATHEKMNAHHDMVSVRQYSASARFDSDKNGKLGGTATAPRNGDSKGALGGIENARRNGDSKEALGGTENARRNGDSKEALGGTENARRNGDSKEALGGIEHTLHDKVGARQIMVLSREIRGMVGEITQRLWIVERWQKEFAHLTVCTPLVERTNRCRSMLVGQQQNLQDVQHQVAAQSATIAQKLANPVAPKLGIPLSKAPYAARFINRTA